MRKIEFETGEYYHIFNRGVDKRKIFLDEKDYIRFLISMREFNREENIESLYRLNQLRYQASREKGNKDRLSENYGKRFFRLSSIKING